MADAVLGGDAEWASGPSEPSVPGGTSLQGKGRSSGTFLGGRT